MFKFLVPVYFLSSSLCGIIAITISGEREVTQENASSGLYFY